MLYLLQVSDSLLQCLGKVVSLQVDHVLLLVIQQADDVGHLWVLVHVEGQVIQRGDGLTFTMGDIRHNIVKDDTFHYIV